MGNGTLKVWDAAESAVESEGLSIHRAAQLYGVPKSTLYDHVSGRISSKAKPGPKPYLTMMEEKVCSYRVPSHQTAGTGYCAGNSPFEV